MGLLVRFPGDERPKREAAESGVMLRVYFREVTYPASWAVARQCGYPLYCMAVA